MRQVNGLVCLVEVEDKQLLFTRGEPAFRAARFESSDFEVFRDAEEAVSVCELLGRRFGSVTCGFVQMTIAEKEEDLGSLLGESDLVIVATFGEGEKVIYGPMVKGRPDCHPLPCAYLSENGMRTFESYGEVVEAVREVQRQSLCPCTLAKFVFKKVDSPLP